MEPHPNDRQASRRASGDLRATADRLFSRFLKGLQPDVDARGDYRSIIGRLDAAVDPSRLFFAFYETLFAPEQIANLCRFVGMEPVAGDFDRRVHEGISLKMRDKQKMKARAYFAPQYDFVAARLGPLPAEWQANMMGAR